MFEGIIQHPICFSKILQVLENEKKIQEHSKACSHPETTTTNRFVTHFKCDENFFVSDWHSNRLPVLDACRMHTFQHVINLQNNRRHCNQKKGSCPPKSFGCQKKSKTIFLSENF